MRLAKPATVSIFERLKSPYVEVTADSVIHFFSLLISFFLPLFARSA